NAVAERLAKGAPLLRKLVWRLPEALQPKPESTVWVVAFDPDSGEVVAGLRTEHPGFGMVTGVVEAAGRPWMGSIGARAGAWAGCAASTLRPAPRPRAEIDSVSLS